MLQVQLQQKEDEVFECQQKLRSIQDEAQRLRQQKQKVASQTTARAEVRMIRQLKKANSELWDIIQDYENKFSLAEEAIETNEAQLRQEERRREDLKRKLARSIDDQVPALVLNPGTNVHMVEIDVMCVCCFCRVTRAAPSQCECTKRSH